jgi:hypothetical protein
MAAKSHTSEIRGSELDWIQVLAHDTIPAYAAFTKPLEKSLQDDREYRIIQLENGLSATIVHDPTADKAAASLDVSVGHLSDPVSNVREHDYVFIAILFDRRLTCLALRIFANICYSWCTYTFFSPPFIQLMRYNQGTEQFPKENEYSEVCAYP